MREEKKKSKGIIPLDFKRYHLVVSTCIFYVQEVQRLIQLQPSLTLDILSFPLTVCKSRLELVRSF